ncbi:MAG: hypothetical protein QOI38_1682 [Sphingomonadales bacterium]|jgi:predicted Fe-S protein YdhL (DUF1289 family)|nr:hypothetical protein [Sphingomonadales bacterium]
MPIFPKIQSPCPYKSNLAAIMDGDVCRMCKRQVFDLTSMTDGERISFLAACEEEVCVSYAIRPALRAAAVAAALAIPAAAAAQDEMFITVGGISDPARVEMVEIADEGTLPELPVVYEDEAGTGGQSEGAGDAPPADPSQG